MSVNRTIAGYGWKRDLPDFRDAYRATARMATELPALVDLRTTGFMPPVYDQGRLGSCTANGIGACVDYQRKRQGLDFITPSRLFVYFGERVIEGDVNQDNGAQIRDGIKVVADSGVCAETTWPYDITQFAVEPSAAAIAEAATHQAVKYERVAQDLWSLKQALADGTPIVFGFTVYSGFEGPEMASGGVLPMPAPTDKAIGGHCVVLVGYEDAHDQFIVRNSWGPDWADGGYFRMPYLYASSASLADDFWAIDLEEAA